MDQNKRNDFESDTEFVCVMVIWRREKLVKSFTWKLVSVLKKLLSSCNNKVSSIIWWHFNDTLLITETTYFWPRTINCSFEERDKQSNSKSRCKSFLISQKLFTALKKNLIILTPEIYFIACKPKPKALKLEKVYWL